MPERNSSHADDGRIDVRIGINLGDVIVEAEDRHGDGVNIAARLQQLAEPGGICISGTVFDQVRAKLAFPYQFVGEQRVKNIAQPIRIYRVPLAAGARLRLPRPRQQRVATAAIVGLLLIAVVAAFAIRWLEPGSRSGASERPYVAVLQFVNMSNDPQQDYFSDGMTEDLITDLSQVAGLLVISRNSTFVYKGKVVPPEQVARELGVGYVLEGSVQRQGDQLRINAQLINGETSVHLWARRYDRTMTDVFAIQDEITRNIVAELQVELSADDQSRVAHIETADVRAYDAFLQGWERYRRNTPQGHAEAIPYFERAIAFDPSYGRAHAALAVTYYDINDSSWNDLLDQLGLDSKSVLERSRQQLDLALQHPTSTAYLLQGEWLRVAGRFD